jgi:hypothetical protein
VSERPSSSWRGPVLAGLIAFVWLIGLSSWLGFTPAQPLATRSDVLFDADAGNVARGLLRPTLPGWGRRFVHPLEALAWRPLARTLRFGLDRAGFGAHANTLAPQVLVAAIAAVGFGALFLLGRELGTPVSVCWLLLVPCLLATANVVSAVPDHFGITSGLLAASCALRETARRPRQRTASWVVAAAAAGNTITNAAFLAIAVTRDVARSRRTVAFYGLGAIAVFAAGILAVARVSDSVDAYVGSIANSRVVNAPLSVVAYAAATFVLPILGPIPSLIRLRRGDLMVTYEPLDVGRYENGQLAGLAVWVVLFLVALTRMLREPRTRALAAVLVSWVLFNAVFHNVWGAEYFLYSPHWAWALMAIAMSGLKDVRARWLALALVPLVAAQAWTLLAIRDAVASIPN